MDIILEEASSRTEDIEDDSEDMAGAVVLNHQCGESKEFSDQVFHRNNNIPPERC